MRDFGFETDPEEGLATVDEEDRFKHMYLVGKSGCGKSTLLTNFIIQEFDHCCIVLDPAGSFADDVAALAPKDRLIYIDDEHPLTINLLNRPEIKDPGKVAREFTQALNSCIQSVSSSPETTALMRELVRNSARVLVGKEKNIKFMAEVLNDPDIRKMFHELGIDGEPNKRYDKYWAEFDKPEPKPMQHQYVYREKRDSGKRVGARLSEFYDTDMMAAFTIGRNQFDIEKFVADRSIVVFNMARLDDDVISFLGNLAIAAVKNYYMNKKKKGGPHLYLYVDEFHRLNVPHWSTMITQSRKHNISINIAHQDHEQIAPAVLSSILGTAHTLATFSCGYKEAKTLSQEYDLPPETLKNLPKHYAYIRIGTSNHRVLTDPPPEIPEWEPPPPTNPEYTKENTEEPYFMADGPEGAWMPAN